MQTPQVAFPTVQYVYCVVGILVSIVLPILRGFLPKPHVSSGEIPPWKRYGAIGLFSLITAIIVVAFGKSSVSSWQWYDALLAGYAWDSTLQKLVSG
jgi:hypothetical protein